MRDQELSVFLEQFLRGCQRLGATGRSWLLAVSGGADSTALLYAAARLAQTARLSLEVGCVDHGLREEASQEVERVRAWSRELGLPFHTEALQLSGSTGLEALAREGRYAALHRMRVRRKLDLIATAHTASDQAETLLMRLARGTSLTGAAGIHSARTDHIIRPLLFATREETEAFVSAMGVAPVQDPMNDDPAYLRTRIRQTVLPVYRDQAGPGVVRALARFSGLAAEDEAYLNGEAQREYARLTSPDGLELEGVRALPRALRRRVIARLISASDLPIDSATIDDALAAIEEGRTATLPGDSLLMCRERRVRVEAAPARRVRSD